MDQEDRQDLQDPQESLESLENLARLDLEGQLDLPAHLDQLDHLVWEDPSVPQVLWDLQALPAQQERGDLVELLDHLAS